MDTLSLHITGSQAIKLMRAARIGRAITAEPAGTDWTVPTPAPLSLLKQRGLDELLEWLNISTENPLRLLVPHRDKRLWSNGVDCAVCSGHMPSGAALLLRPASGSEALRLPADIRVYVDSPPLAFMQMVSALEDRLAKPGSEGLCARLQLIEFACECCGSFVRDPHNPRTDIVRYDRPGEDTRFCTLDDMREFMQEASHMYGRKRALQLLPHVVDLSGSGMETYLNLALAGAPKLGGLAMPRPIVNRQLVIDKDVAALLKHEGLRPDMQWPDYRTLAEYLGDEEHAGKVARVEDKNRLQDYNVAGYIAFTLMFDDVRNASALNRTAQMIARTLMQQGKRNELYRVRNLQKNEGFLTRQATLISTLLPPVTKYDA